MYVCIKKKSYIHTYIHEVSRGGGLVKTRTPVTPVTSVWTTFRWTLATFRLTLTTFRWILTTFRGR